MDDEQIRKIYRQTLEEGIDWESLKEEKAEFIAAHFSSSPRFGLKPQLLVPVLSFCLVLGAFLTLLPEQIQKPSRPAAVISNQSVISPPSFDSAGITEPASLPAPISITHVHSDVGTPMVFQRMVNEVPVVLIWIFPGKNAAT